MIVKVIKEIPGLLSLAGIAAVSVAPRMPFDIAWITIGGNLSRPFRIFILIQLFCILFRAGWRSQSIIKHTIYAFESLGVTWLCLLTPYLLRRYLARTRGNMVHPSAALQSWFFVVTVLVATGIGLAKAMKQPKLWALVRTGDLVSTVPVVHTINLYHKQQQQQQQQRQQLEGRTTSHSTNRSSHRTIISQSVLTYEYFFAFLMFTQAIGEAMQEKNPIGFAQTFYKRLRFNSTTDSRWVRILLHALFINMLDETSQLTVAAEDETDLGALVMFRQCQGDESSNETRDSLRNEGNPSCYVIKDSHNTGWHNS